MTCPLSLVTKRGSSFRFFRVVLYFGGEYRIFFFLGGVYWYVVRTLFIFHFFFIYIHCNLSFIYDDDVCFSSPISTYVISFLSLYTCFFMYVILIFVSHMMS